MYGRDRYPELFELLEEMYELLNENNEDLAFLTEAHLQLRSLTAEGGHTQAPPFQGGERVTESADLKRRLARKPKPKQ